MGHLYQDTDTMMNLIRLCDSESQVKYLLQHQFKISIEEVLRKSCLFYGNFCKEFESKGKIEYNNFYLDGISNKLLDNSEEEDILEEDNSKTVEKVVQEVRQVNSNRMFSVFPVSYGNDIDMDFWSPPSDSKITSYLQNLENRQLILGSDDHISQIITPSPAIYDVKENADIMIGCDKTPSNFLYVLFADKPEVNQRFI